MAPRRLIDTNVLVRFLVQDDEKNALIATQFFAACSRGEIAGIVPESVLAECIYVMESFYARNRQEIATALNIVLTGGGVTVDNEAIVLDALERYRNSKLHFIDCIIVASAIAMGLDVATFDREIGNVPGVNVRLN